MLEKIRETVTSLFIHLSLTGFVFAEKGGGLGFTGNLGQGQTPESVNSSLPKLKIVQSNSDRPVIEPKWTEVTTYEWTVDKAANPASVTIEKDDSDTVEFTITATRNNGPIENRHFVDIKGIKVENTGDTPTIALKIKATVKSKFDSDDWTPISDAVIEIISEDQLPNDGQAKIFDILGVPFSNVDGATKYRVVIMAYDSSFNVDDSCHLEFEPSSAPTSTLKLDETATFSDDTLGTASEGFAWDYKDSVSFPQPALTSGAQYVYSVVIENQNADPDETFSFMNTVTLTEADSKQKRTDETSVSVNSGNGEENGDDEADDGDNYPAAPGIANALLNDAGWTGARGDIIKAVTQAMEPGNKIGDLVPSDGEDYVDAVKDILNDLVG